MYDSAVEVPRTTKWRRSLEFNNRTVEEEVVDVRDGRFFRCLIVDGVLYHSKSYKRVVARNDYTVEFQQMDNNYYGTVHTYVKVQDKCLKAICSQQRCCCDLASQYLAIVKVLEQDVEQLPKYRGRTVVHHITKVKTSNRYC